MGDMTNLQHFPPPSLPSGEPTVAFLRWRLTLPSGASVKGLPEAEAHRAADELGGAVSWSLVRMWDTPDGGVEVLGPWQEVSPSPPPRPQ